MYTITHFFTFMLLNAIGIQQAEVQDGSFQLFIKEWRTIYANSITLVEKNKHSKASPKAKIILDKDVISFNHDTEVFFVTMAKTKEKKALLSTSPSFPKKSKKSIQSNKSLEY